MDAMWIIIFLICLITIQAAMLLVLLSFLTRVVNSLENIEQLKKTQVNEEVMADYNKESSRVFFKPH